MRKCWYTAFFPFFTMFSTPLRDQSHSLIHILFVLCRRFRLMSLKLYCLVIHIFHKTFEIGCVWSKGSGERLQGHHGPLVIIFQRFEASDFKNIEKQCVLNINTNQLPSWLGVLIKVMLHLMLRYVVCVFEIASQCTSISHNSMFMLMNCSDFDGINLKIVKQMCVNTLFIHTKT